LDLSLEAAELGQRLGLISGSCRVWKEPWNYLWKLQSLEIALDLSLEAIEFRGTMEYLSKLLSLINTMALSIEAAEY